MLEKNEASGCGTGRKEKGRRQDGNEDKVSECFINMMYRDC